MLGDWLILIPSAFSAVEREDLAWLTKYLDDGGSVDICHPDGSNLLHYAAYLGSMKCIQFLLDRGATVNATNHYGKTPLHFAAENGQVDCVQLLLERGAAREIADCHSRQPIDLCACIKNRETAEQIEGLLQGGGQATKATNPVNE